MADGDPEDDLPLDPPDEEVEQEQETETEEAEATPEGEAEAEPGEQDPPTSREPSRGERRFQTLSTELQEQRRRNDDLNRRLDQVLAGAPRQPQGESPEQRAQRLALLTPEERITETLRESEVKHAREMQGLQFAILDGNDRAAFEAKCTVDPLFAKWKPRVDTELATLRQQGQNVDREKLMFYLIGKNAVEGRKANVGKQRQEAQRRVAGQRTRPSNSGSDTAPNRSRNTSLERRLENQSI